jgi:drug/metabolite transporter (DMT)-like permease
LMVDILAGLALGILGAAAYAIGVNLTHYVPQAKVGEALIFFVSGIISYMRRIPRRTKG